MSRIYEALQKAESERSTDRIERGFEPEPLPQESYPGSRSALLEAEYDINTASARAEAMGAASESSASLSLLDLGQVRRCPWNPVPDSLPALMERGPAVEQFRSLRSRIFELRDLNPLKSILVSSGLPQEGKSFVAANLAVSLARNKNSRVLLIDGDMRRFTLHKLLGCESEPGLADFLAGKATALDVMQRGETSSDHQDHQILSAVLPNLTFIPAGDGGDKAADLSGNRRFADLISSLGPLFDWIIVDSSPVLPVSDAVNLARACDGVLLVARSGVTELETAQRAQNELKASNILGFVLNAVENPPESGTYYGYDAQKA